MDNFSNLTDSELDALYASYYDTRNVNGYSLVAQTIITRLQNPWSFTKGFFGFVQFPLYDERQKDGGNGFQQVEAAQSSVKTAAGNVVDSVSNIGFGVMGIAVVLLFFIAFLKFKK